MPFSSVQHSVQRWYLLLALVDLDVPLAPDLGRGEHATGAAHVTEGGLTSTVGTTTRDTGDTGNSTTCISLVSQTVFHRSVALIPSGNLCAPNSTQSSPGFCEKAYPPMPPQNVTEKRATLTSSPRLGRGLVTSLLAHGIRLTLVLSDTSVHLLDNVRSDRAGEDSRNGVGSSSGSTIFADDRNGRSRSHCDGWGTWTLQEKMMMLANGSGKVVLENLRRQEATGGKHTWSLGGVEVGCRG